MRSQKTIVQRKMMMANASPTEIFGYNIRGIRRKSKGFSSETFRAQMNSARRHRGRERELSGVDTEGTLSRQQTQVWHLVIKWASEDEGRKVENANIRR